MYGPLDDWWWSNGQHHVPVSITILSSRSIGSRWKLRVDVSLAYSPSYSQSMQQCFKSKFIRWSFHARTLTEQYIRTHTRTQYITAHHCCTFRIFNAAHPESVESTKVSSYKVCPKLNPFGNLTLEQVNLLVWRIYSLCNAFVCDIRKNDRPIFCWNVCVRFEWIGERDGRTIWRVIVGINFQRTQIFYILHILYRIFIRFTMTMVLIETWRA